MLFRLLGFLYRRPYVSPTRMCARMTPLGVKLAWISISNASR